jgi:hypothetical protein
LPRQSLELFEAPCVKCSGKDRCGSKAETLSDTY